MTRFDLTGYIASGLVLGAFSMKNMVQLRIAAIASNVAFIGYGLGLDLIPVVALHVALLPLNVWRLWEVLRDLTGSNGRPWYPTKITISFAALPMKAAVGLVFLVITMAVAGWLVVTQGESRASVPSRGLHDLKRPGSPSGPTLIPVL